MADCCVKTMLEDASERLRWLRFMRPFPPEDVLEILGEIARDVNQSIGWLRQNSEGRCRQCRAEESLDGRPDR